MLEIKIHPAILIGIILVCITIGCSCCLVPQLLGLAIPMLDVGPRNYVTEIRALNDLLPALETEFPSENISYKVNNLSSLNVVFINPQYYSFYQEGEEKSVEEIAHYISDQLQGVEPLKFLVITIETKHSDEPNPLTQSRDYRFTFEELR
jgi:hypothetical protein